jgi:serine/threonine protein kinase/Tfp pilus assembly protein PilF
MTDPARPDEPRPTPTAMPTATWSSATGGSTAAPLAPIGPYTILEKLGEGGFGEVYVADQSEPVRRRVALKILKAGMDTKAVLARFEAERQALARMDHPNVATVLDAGVTQQGRSYFVMELVQGEPITTYCDRHMLGIRERLELFILVCNAVQHAHQKGIIHRDLKPSNILVTLVDEVATPKVIDFGIAKATSAALTDETIQTMQGELMGTPEYMSPEQAEMGALDIDTRTDIYSLGIILYELLSGELPFDSRTLRRGGLIELHRIIREQEPPRPSTKLTTSAGDPTAVAKRRGTEMRTLSRILRDDLDWVVLKAMEKDRARRYESASALAQEIRRYLSDQPLLAGPPRASYRMSKFVRRHRAAVVGGTIVVLALMAGIAGLAFGLVRARQAEAAARRESATAEKVLDFMVGLFNVSDPSESRGNSITAREILDKGVADIGKGLEAEPLVQARLMTTMGDVYKELGLYPESRSLLENGLAIREEALGSNDLKVAESLNSLANVMDNMGDHAAAQQKFERAIAIKEKLLGPDDLSVAASLGNLGISLRKAGEYAEAERVNARALVIREKALGPDDPQVATSLTSIAAVMQETGRDAEARPLVERALAIREKAFGPDHQIVAGSLNSLAALYWAAGDQAKAKLHWERALAISEKNLGPEHPTLGTYVNNLGAAYYATEDYAGARDLFLRALAIREKTLGPDHHEVANTLNNLAGTLQAMGDVAGAKPLLERSLVILEKGLGPDHREVGAAVNNLAVVYMKTGDYARARAYLDRAQTIYEKSLPPDHPFVLDNMRARAELLRETGDIAGADAMDARVRSIQEKSRPGKSGGS